MNNITDLLINILSNLIDNGFELPIYMFAVSQNGSLVAAKYKGNPLAEVTKAHVFAEHFESDGWSLPINCFFVDGTGKSESFRITPESFTDTSTTH
jgi:hypothetical protein